MADIAECRTVIEKFKNEHPGIVRSISEIINLQECWPQRMWGSYYAPGVYIMLNNRGSVIYVGESVAPARRMDSYFEYDSATKILATKHPWAEQPISVVIVTMVDERAARFLERYLIFKLDPSCNKY